MELLQELSFSNTRTISCPLNRSGMIKILASGELAANGIDHGLLIRFNRETTNYKSFVHMGGDAGLNEWANEKGYDSGIYTGRNGWGHDATFMLDYTFTINTNYLKVTGSGMSAFALGNNSFLSYESHGVFLANRPVTEIEVGFTGGIVRMGDLRIYHI